mgnify:CR=1 FL=1
MLQLHILFADLGISRIPFLIRAVCIPHVQLVSRLQYVEHVFEEGVLFEKQAVVTHEVERIAVCMMLVTPVGKLAVTMVFVLVFSAQ